MWLQCFPELEKLIEPYYTRRFNPRWRGDFNKHTAFFQEHVKPRVWKVSEEPDYAAFLSGKVVGDLLSFLSEYGEGAYVALEMLVCATNGGPSINLYSGSSAEYYTAWCAGALPEVEGLEADSVLYEVQSIHDFMRKNREEFARRCLSYFDLREHKRQQWRGVYRDDDGKRMSSERLANYQLYAVKEAGFRVGSVGCVYERSFIEDFNKREDVVILTDLLKQYSEWFRKELSATARGVWDGLSGFTKAYLLARAGDEIFLGEEVANATFPELKGCEGIVGALRGLYRHKEQMEEEKWVKEKRQRIDRECECKVAEITVPVPVNVVDRVLTGEERRQVRFVLEKEFCQSALVMGMIKIVKEFVAFCERLSIPENHIKVPTGQYIERQVKAPQEFDMVNEAARLLSSLHWYTAYVKIGGASGWKAKIQTEKLSRVGDDALERAIEATKAGVEKHTRLREEIREEIKKRQEPWRSGGKVQATVAGTGVETDAPAPQKNGSVGLEEEPPPRTRATTTRKAGEKSMREEEAPRTKGKLAGAGGRVPEQQAGIESAREESGSDRAARPQSSKRYRLVYKSDFTKPTGWDEEHSDRVKVFRLDGYYHIAIHGGSCNVCFAPPLVLDDFKAQVDVGINPQSGTNSSCGLAFCAEENKAEGTYFFYAFTVGPGGFYRVYAASDQDARGIIDTTNTDIINPGGLLNSLMIEKVGKKLTLGINGRNIATTTDSDLRPGRVGLYVCAFKADLYAEARFRNFSLYSIE